MLKFKVILAALVSILPMNILRVLGYLLLGYKIQGARIGFGTLIAVSHAELRHCRVGMFNLFIGPMSLKVLHGASVGNRNTFSCGFWTIKKEYEHRGYSRSLLVEKDALITSGHYFDLAGAFKLGSRSWVAGIGSQFWTHGAGVLDRDIQIAEDCYLGSAVRFAPGTSVGKHVIVAMGSVVTKKFVESFALIGGVPAAVLKEDYDWKMHEDQSTPLGI